MISKTKMNPLFRNNEKPRIVSYHSFSEFGGKVDWDNEIQRENVFQIGLMQAENLIKNSNLDDYFDYISSTPMMEFGISKNEVINVLVKHLDDQPVLIYSLQRVWYHLMSDSEFMVSFMTGVYRNVTTKINQFNLQEVVDLTNILFNQLDYEPTCTSYVDVNDKIYKLTTCELMLLSVIRSNKLWVTWSDEIENLLLFTHGLKNKSYDSFNQSLFNDYMAQMESMNYIAFSINLNGLLMMKYDKFAFKIAQLQTIKKHYDIFHVEKGHALCNLSHTDQCMITIDRTNQRLSFLTEVGILVDIATSIMRQTGTNSITIEELISIAVVSGNADSFLDDILKIVNSNDVEVIKRLLHYPLKDVNVVEQRQNIPLVIQLIESSFNRSSKKFKVSLKTYLKLIAISNLFNHPMQIEEHYQAKVGAILITSETIEEAILLAHNGLVQPVLYGELLIIARYGEFKIKFF